MQRLIFLLALLPIACANAEGEWTDLFKGAAHEDFYFDFEEEAEAEDVFEITPAGALIIHGKDHSPAYLQTLDEYENYELKFEWRWPEDSDDPGTSGIQIHCTEFTSLGIWPEGIEIDLAEDKTGDFWLYNQKLEVDEKQLPNRGSERNRRLRIAGKDEEEKPGKWNEMRIVAKDDTLKVYLNDELVNEATEVSATSGLITFRAEESDIEFRAVQIKDL